MAELRPAAYAADWIAERVRDFDGVVGAMVPAVFESYARAFHPASRGTDDDAADVRWADVASANNRVMHPAAEWGSLTGSWQTKEQTDLWSREPCVGRLPQRLAPRLADTLAPYTDHSDHCYFGVWEGWGEPSFMFLFKEGTPEEVRRRTEKLREQELEAEVAAWRGLLDVAPTFDLPHRRMHLLQGPLDSIREFYENHREPPSIWWPADRAWCMATDIDLMTTYVGGSHDAIQALLDSEQIESLPVPVDQSITWEADAINPLPLPPR